jgi:hypothetical protein
MNTLGFFDNFVIQKSLQLKRRYFEPDLIEESLYFDPKYSFSYSTIRWCPEVNKYRLWVNINQVVCVVGKDGKPADNSTDEHFMLTLAESDDCIHWRPFHASDNETLGTNVVFAGSGGSVHGATVLRDEKETNPARLYKCATSIDNIGVVQHYSPGIIATSPDGINWNEEGKKFQWGTSMSDAYNDFFYNPVIGKYQVIMRNIVTDRRICTTTSEDLIHWSKPEVILTPDSLDAGSCEFYGMTAFYHQGIFYGFLWIFDTDMFDTVPQKFAGSVTPELVYSYDGLHWNRTHHPAVTPRKIGEYGATDAYLFNICESKDKQEWFIASCYPRHEHGGTLYPDQIKREANPQLNAYYTLRIKPGRFCGLQSTGQGLLRLKKIYLKEAKLSINVAAPHGKMRVQLTDLWYKPVPGFAFEDSIPFIGDDIAYIPRWKNKTVEDIKGRAFGIEIELNTGCIFGVTGDFYPFYACLPQKSLGDPAHVGKEVFGQDTHEPDYEGISLK